jgi:hypothetical protein
MWWFPNAFTSTDCILWQTTRTKALEPKPSLLSRAMSPLMTYLIHILHGFFFLLVVHLAPALQPLLNTAVYVLRSASLPTTLPPTSSWKAQLMDCLYYQLVDEWAVPFAPENEKTSSGSFTSTVNP